jgi:hypothetical protein
MRKKTGLSAIFITLFLGIAFNAYALPVVNYTNTFNSGTGIWKFTLPRIIARFLTVFIPYITMYIYWLGHVHTCVICYKDFACLILSVYLIYFMKNILD